MESNARVLIERVGAVAVLTMNRPEKRNAVDLAMASSIVEAIAAGQDAGAIVLTGADPAFCAGLDLKNLGTDRLIDLPRFINAVADSAVPVIAAVNGAAATGGFEVALAADFIVASDRARFADTHLRVGVYPGPVLVDLPRRVGKAWARQMSLTGDYIDAVTALRIGLANEVVPHEQLLARVMQLAASIAEQDRRMVAVARDDWRATDGVQYDEAHKMHGRTAVQAGCAGSTSAGLNERSAVVIARAHESAR